MDSPNTDLSVFTSQASHQETGLTTGVASPSRSSQDNGKARATEVVKGAAEQLTRQRSTRWSMLTPEDYNAATREPDSARVLAIRERKIQEHNEHLAAQEAAIKFSFRKAFTAELKAELSAGKKALKASWYRLWRTEEPVEALDEGIRAYDEVKEARIIGKLGKAVWPWNEEGAKPDEEGKYACTVKRVQLSENVEVAQPAEEVTTLEADESAKASQAIEVPEAGKAAEMVDVTEVAQLLEAPLAREVSGASARQSDGAMSLKAVSTPPVTRWGRPEPPRALSHKASMMPMDISDHRDE